MSTKLVAAGGLLERKKSGKLHIAVCRRKRYRNRDGSVGDWVLPKGKPDAGETLKETALREVEEETGCSGRILDYKFVIEYKVGGRWKKVTFYQMEFVAKTGKPDADEIAKVKWMTPKKAFDKLTYDTERDVVERAYEVHR